MAKNQNNPAQTQNQSNKYDLRLSPEVQVNQSLRTYKLSIECIVSKSNSAVVGQTVIVKKGNSVKYSAATDTNGIIVYVTKGNLEDQEQIISLRFSLAGFATEELISITLPGIEKTAKSVAASDDPEFLSVYRHRDTFGRFGVFVRILKSEGKGIAAPFSVWYKGVRSDYRTDKNGVFDFSIFNVNQGDDEDLQVFVSGIEERAKIRIHYPSVKASYREVKKWIIRTNNGRALIFFSLVILFWLSIFFSVSSPVISPNLFRDQKTGLSSAEKFYNESVKMADSNKLSAHDSLSLVVPQNISSPLPDNALIFGIIFTVFAVMYFILSWREEVMAGIESGLERIVDKNSDRANDPIIERWMKHFGMMHKVGGGKIKVTEVNSSTPAAAGTAADSKNSGHPSLGTLFQLDLISESLVEIVPAIIKKMFGK